VSETETCPVVYHIHMKRQHAKNPDPPHVEPSVEMPHTQAEKKRNKKHKIVNSNSTHQNNSSVDSSSVDTSSVDTSSVDTGSVDTSVDTSSVDTSGADMSVRPHSPMGKSSLKTPQKPETVTEDKLRNFVLFKAFDIIGDGGYRRFVLKNKNNGEPWAVGIYNDAHNTSRFLRSTLQLIGQLAGNVPCAKLHKLCQRVTSDMNPPSVSAHGWCICALTGMRTENTTQLGRSNKGEVCYVHRKFHGFFTMLWFIARFELCIKYATIQWLQRNNATANHNIQQLCEKLQTDPSFTKNICRSILHATQHVTDSVIMHIKRTGRGTMLNVNA
jgi:hypothetical protein